MAVHAATRKRGLVPSSYIEKGPHLVSICVHLPTLKSSAPLPLPPPPPSTTNHQHPDLPPPPPHEPLTCSSGHNPRQVNWFRAGIKSFY